MRTGEMFPGYGNKITFKNSRNLRKKISEIDISKTGTNLEKERYAIVRYFQFLNHHNFFTFPIDVENIDLGEGKSIPDFRINVNGYEYYLEVTIASTTQFMDETDTMKKDVLYEPNITIDGDTIEDVNVKMIEVKDKLKGGPIYGDMPEVLAGKILSYAILKKTKKLKNYEIDKSKDVELLLTYFFTATGGLDWKKSISYAIQNLDQDEYPKLTPLDRIHALKGRQFLFNILDRTGVCLTLPYKENMWYKIERFIKGIFNIKNKSIFTNFPTFPGTI